MRQVALTPTILQILRPALWGATATIRKEIAQGKSQLFQTSGNNLYVVLRPEGKQLVVVAVAGRNLRMSRNEIIGSAITHGFTSIRFHTKAPQHLEKGLQGLNVELLEKRSRLLGSPEYVFIVRL